MIHLLCFVEEYSTKKELSPLTPLSPDLRLAAAFTVSMRRPSFNWTVFQVGLSHEYKMEHCLLEL